MARPKRTGTKYLGVDVDEGDFDFLKKCADDDDRPLASLVRKIFKEWIQQKQPAKRGSRKRG